MYLFVNTVTGQQYFGSAICLYTRYKAHIVNSTRPNRGGDNPLYTSIRKYGANCFTWQPIIMTNNHLTSYIEQNPGISLDLTEVYILRAFTQFEVRGLEQALLSHFSPALNGTYTVVFPFVKWQAGDIIKDQGSVPLVVKSVDGKLNLNYASKSKAAIALGIPKTTLDRYTNLKKFPVYSPILGTEVLLIDESRPLSDDAPVFSSESLIPTISGVNLTALEKGKLYALCMDKKTVYGIYINSREAATTLDGRLDSRYISRYINKEYPITVGEDQEPVFFVMHPE